MKHSSKLKYITVQADAAPALQSGDGVATALSCGVDSFWSIHKHLSSKYKEYDLTHVCINNVGAFNECYNGYGADKVKEERYRIAEQVAKELGVELVSTDSNFADVYKQDHLLTCSYSNVFAIYMLQKLWRIYYVCSNGIDFAEFSLADNDLRSSEQSELFLLQYFSIPNLRLYCDGGELSRIEKTRDICSVGYVQKYLHVCVSKPFNCGVCPKCRRTLLTIDSVGNLDDFKESFDIGYYKKHKDEYFAWVFREHFFGSKMNDPLFDLIKKREDYKGNFVYFLMNIKGKIKNLTRRSK